jgi:hypothetical protein
VSLLKKLLGAKPAKKAAPQPKAKTGASRANTYVTSKTDRAQVIAEAMAVFRREKKQMAAGLDEALAKIRAEAPKALKDPEALARLLSLYKAHVDLRRMMASDNKRFLVLTGMRELLEDEPKPPAKPRPKR